MTESLNICVYSSWNLDYKQSQWFVFLRIDLWSECAINNFPAIKHFKLSRNANWDALENITWRKWAVVVKIDIYWQTCNKGWNVEPVNIILENKIDFGEGNKYLAIYLAWASGRGPPAILLRDLNSQVTAWLLSPLTHNDTSPDPRYFLNIVRSWESGSNWTLE